MEKLLFLMLTFTFSHAQKEERNVFTFWERKEYLLIKILRNLMELNSLNGNGYKFHLINYANAEKYVGKLPPYFFKLQLAHQADYIRVKAVKDHGGIWLDSDTLTLDKFDNLFNDLYRCGSFFVFEGKDMICNGVFGSIKNSLIMTKWDSKMTNILDVKQEKIHWTEVGNAILTNSLREEIKKCSLYDGPNTIFPINWNEQVSIYFDKNIIPSSIERKFQPVIILVNSVYKKVDELYKTFDDVYNSQNPLGYFIRKAFQKVTENFTDYDFIEIGTSDFDTLIQTADHQTKGISVEPIKHYLDSLPNKPNVIKINKAISNVSGTINIFSIPKDVIEKHNIPYWFKGCNSVGNLHSLHISHGYERFVKNETVETIDIKTLFITNKVRRVNYLKIDVEGHDTIIVKSLYNYIKFLPKEFYPRKILFETNSNSETKEVDEVVSLFSGIGYKMKSRGHDTIIEI